MKRRTALELLGTSIGAYALLPRPFLRGGQVAKMQDQGGETDSAFSKLRGESICRAEVRVERGGPRLYVNGRETYPFLALSDELLPTIAGYRDSGISMFTPILGLNAAWIAPGKYDWNAFDLFFARLLAIHPAAFFLPRLHLNPPAWWKEAHPGELVVCGITPDPTMYRQKERLGESGLNWNGLNDPNDASWASVIWRNEISEVLIAFLRHMESSPLASRMFGYQVAYGHTGEWHYTGMRFLPDYSEPMRKAIGPIPEPAARMTTTAGLLRDPAREHDVIAFYGRHHDLIADTLLHFASITKEQTGRRILCGAFFGYLLENVHIQEGGHLSPERVLASADVDFLASPYTYQHTNMMPFRERWESDMVDDAGNWLGRARGVGGDGSNRVLVESIHRHGKLYFVEIDPSTYIEPHKAGEGGSGHASVTGSINILRRDLGQMFARGNGGWLFDFGHLCPPYEAHHGWYDDPPLIDAIRPFAKLGEQRLRMDITSAAQVAAVYDPKAFFATEHWKAEEPYTGFGITVCDHINHWFINSQQRTFARMAAPYDSLYRFDLTRDDPRRYRLLFMVNLYTMDRKEVDRLLSMMEGSGVTVVWYYAPGFIAPDRFDLGQMERLTGFRYEVLNEPGPMQIRVDGMGGNGVTIFGTRKPQKPRFAVLDSDAEVLGKWVDNGRPAFVRKAREGWTSVYVGAAPMTAEILRSIAQEAGVALWSDRTDIVYASHDAAAVIATAEGERTLTFPRAMQSEEGGSPSTIHKVTMGFGDVRIFIAPSLL
jgi:beta-galactosidase